MYRGDISGAAQPRAVFVFEGLVGTLPDDHKYQAKLFEKLGAWKKLANMYELDPWLYLRLMDMAWRWSVPIDVVTFKLSKHPPHQEFAEHIQEILERKKYPVAWVEAKKPEDLVREANAPHIWAVFHNDPDHQFTFGKKSRLVIDPRITSFL